MTQADPYGAEYKYNPWDPRNWNLFAQLNFILALLLISDWTLGMLLGYGPTHFSYFARIFQGVEIFEYYFPLIFYVGILLLTPFLDRELEETPFYGAILIKILLFMFACQYTLLGEIARFLLGLACSVVIVVVLVFSVVLEVRMSLDYVQVIGMGIFFLAVHWILNLIFYGFRANEWWAILLISVSILGMLILRFDKIRLGGLILLILFVLNNYIVPFELSGLDVGAFLIFTCAILVIIAYYFQ